MDRKHNPAITHLAMQLRHNMTKEERHLWYDFLRDYPVKFTRQKVMGKYIADFYSPKAKVVLEIDGSQHYIEIGIEKDTERTAYLEQFGVVVVRIANNQVNNNFQGVCLFIQMIVNERINASEAKS